MVERRKTLSLISSQDEIITHISLKSWEKQLRKNRPYKSFILGGKETLKKKRNIIAAGFIRKKEVLLEFKPDPYFW